MEPAYEAEIWVPILADPLSCPPSSVPLPSQIKDDFYSMYGDDTVEIHHSVQESHDKQLQDQCLGDCIPKDWTRAPRGPRMRRNFPSDKQYFGNVPFAYKGRKHGVRENNDHWTNKEVTVLVNGVTDYGVGRWSKMKKKCFSTSVRTAVHLKDKWRNLVKTSKGKTEKKRLLRLDSELIEKIKKLAVDQPYPKPSSTE